MDLTESSSRVTSKWVSDGLDVVKLSFVHQINDLSNSPQYDAGFVYQHFGENETIFGYEGLRVNINYSDASLYIYPEIKYTSEYKEDPDIKPDNVLSLLKAQLPEDQMNIIVESKAEFNGHLINQQSFQPFGELISKFVSGSSEMEIYKIAESSPEFDAYLARAQTLALWYIEASTYTDNSDEQWLHYFIFESCDSGEGDGSKYRKFAGYASLYRYYAYPDKIRPRVAQILLLPQYRGDGTAAKLLQSVYRDLWATTKVMDITVEDPADSFIFLRDYVDCTNCLGLTAFSPQNLKKGFSDEMRVAALEKFKICRRQARRVYEILRFRTTNKNDTDELKAFRLDVKRRLHAPLRKTDKDWKKMNSALSPEELTQAAVNERDPKEMHAYLEQLYNLTTEEYKKTIDRLENYPNIF